MDTNSLICALMLVFGFWFWLADCKQDNASARLQSPANAPPQRTGTYPARMRTRVVRVPELDGERGAAQMELSTYEYSLDLIISAARISFARDGRTDFSLYGDFSKIVREVRSQASQENLDGQHSGNFSYDVIDALKAEAMAFYARRRNL
jgi:hypothetical protein